MLLEIHPHFLVGDGDAEIRVPGQRQAEFILEHFPRESQTFQQSFRVVPASANQVFQT